MYDALYKSTHHHHHLCVCVYVCLSVCLSAAVCPHYSTDPDVTWGSRGGCPLVVHYWADLQSVHTLRCYGNNTNPSYKLASILRYDDIVRTLGGVCARCWPAFSKLRAAYGKWSRLADRRLAVDGGRSQHYCGGLDCGLSMVAFWQHYTNAKC